jgi:hypothetical protein
MNYIGKNKMNKKAVELELLMVEPPKQLISIPPPGLQTLPLKKK